MPKRKRYRIAKKLIVDDIASEKYFDLEGDANFGYQYYPNDGLAVNKYWKEKQFGIYIANSILRMIGWYSISNITGKRMYLRNFADRYLDKNNISYYVDLRIAEYVLMNFLNNGYIEDKDRSFFLTGLVGKQQIIDVREAIDEARQIQPNNTYAKRAKEELKKLGVR